MLFCVVMAIQIMLVAFLYSQKVFFECIVSYFIVFSVSNPTRIIKNYVSALIAVGRDISRGRTYRNSKILSSDLTPGNRLITWESEENKIEWVTTPGHTGHCCSLFISGHIQVGSSDLKREQRVAFVGDLWDEENDEEFWRDISENPEIQAKSREYVIQQNFDLIIPGHGPPFTSKV